MVGTTLRITNNLIIIELDKVNTMENIFNDCDNQTVVFLTSVLGGYIINYCDKTITLFLTLKGINRYEIDFKRGSCERSIMQRNFDIAVSILTGTICEPRKRQRI
jgi:hypothetical protein